MDVYGYGYGNRIDGCLVHGNQVDGVVMHGNRRCWIPVFRNRVYLVLAYGNRVYEALIQNWVYGAMVYGYRGCRILMYGY